MSKKLVALSTVLMLLVVMLGAQPVARDELMSVQERPIEFINYVGPYSRIDSVDAIRGIGLSLGRSIAAGARQAGERSRYYVIHAVDPAVPTGFEADILILGADTNIDHIRNLRRIVGAYLEAAYGYSTRDADTLAVFITIYNAVYRGRLDYFRGLYKSVVLAELTAETAGLALRWDEWPGKSRIVIPLTSRAASGVIGSVATTPITDPATVDSIRRETEDAGIATRQDMVDIKERDVAQEEAAIAAERLRLEEETRRLQEEATRREAERAAEAERLAAAEAASRAAVDPAAPGDQQTGGLTETAAAREADRAAEEQRAAAEQRAATEQARIDAEKAALAAREEAVAEKREEIAADRTAIAADQREQIAEEVRAAAGEAEAGVVLFELMNPLMPLSRLVLVNLESGRRLRRSELNTIWASTAVDTGEAIIAVAGMATSAGGAVRLVRINKADYADVVESKLEIFADTMIWYYDSAIYAVTRKDGKWVIGRYDSAKLELQASSEAVSQWTSLTKSGNRLVAQKPAGGFLVMDAVTLKTASEIQP